MLSAIPEEIKQALSEGFGGTLKNFSFAGGGCINHAGRLDTSTSHFFLKWNDRQKFPGMFAAEAKGLMLLRNAGVIRIPGVVLAGESGSHQFIVLEFIAEKGRAGGFWTALGHQLASLHRKTSEKFGLDHDNYIGSLRQVNTFCADWVDFFIENRLKPQVALATMNGKIAKEVAAQFEVLYAKLHSILPAEKPSLLHGDLWSGNLIADANGDPCLVDPAAYFGNREVEIAFTTLFGGFPPEFYDSYNEDFPLAPGFRERSDVYNLYPLMVHVNLFGGGYASQVVSILGRFV